MGNTSSRQYTYQQYYAAMKQSGKKIDLTNVDIKDINPYEVFNLSKNFTWDELKESYKELALSTHPDKNGGDNQLFNIVTTCFKKMAQDYKNRDNDKPHHELKQQSKQYYNSNDIDNRLKDAFLGGNKKISNDMFNKTFEKCKIDDDENDFGYGNIMDKSSKIRDDIKINKLFTKDKVDNNTFNDIFNKNVPVAKSSIVKYKEPEPLVLAKSMQFTELGGKRPDDYSSSVEQRSLAYTDYMRAYDGNRFIDEDLIKNRKEFKSVKEYEKYRDNKVKRELSTKEKKYMEQKTLKEEQEEINRLERVKKNDIMAEKAFEKANRLFLQ